MTPNNTFILTDDLWTSNLQRTLVFPGPRWMHVLPAALGGAYRPAL